MDKTGNNDTAAILAAQSAVPVHVAVIMDGNGRWAKA
ncbi:MAG: isoprenyl transferase, partial [Gammaproteobacteria bacterium]|nr:isoprenyl transferase [Gammaproteobacteria bacterium]